MGSRVVMGEHVLRAIGDSDCEELGAGWLAQPVNAITSLAYVGVGVWIVSRTFIDGVDRVRSLVYAACLAAVGVGSVLFHGPQPAGARLLHDLPILLTVLFIVLQDLRLIGRLRADLPVFVVAAAVATIASVVAADVGTVLTGVGVATVAVLEAVIYRRRLRPVTDRRQVRAYVAIVGVAGVAAASWLLGRTGSPACDPDGYVQLHGAWHVISSLVFGLWWWLAMWMPTRPDAGSARTGRADAVHGVERR